MDYFGLIFKCWEHRKHIQIYVMGPYSMRRHSFNILLEKSPCNTPVCNIFMYNLALTQALHVMLLFHTATT